MVQKERKAQINNLLLSDSAPSYKELYFIQQGENFLRESGHRDFFEATKECLPYDEVYRSWQAAVNQFTIRLPKGLLPSSPSEREEFELFFLKLRHASLWAAFAEHRSLEEKWSSNQDFLTAVADTIRQRLAPDERSMSLEHYLLCGWLHSELWLLDNENKAQLLRCVYRVTEVSGDAIRKAVKKLGLKDWSDFLPKGSSAPYKVLGWKDKEAGDMCQIVPQGEDG